MKSIKDTQLKSIIAEVHTELDAIFKSEKEKLLKAHPGEEISSEVPADESATEPSEPSAAPAAPEASAAPSDSPPVDASAPPEGDAPAADAAPEGDPAADASGDFDGLVGEYSKLHPEELKAHYMACKQALFAIMGAGGPPPGADAGAGSPPPPAAPPAPPIADQSAPALKAEKEIEELKEKLAKTEGAVMGLLKAISSPSRKAVTSIADLAKSDTVDVTTLEKSEVHSRLKKASENPSLSKADRSLINSFGYGEIGVDKVAHLIK